jgi:hypothetical protein
MTGGDYEVLKPAARSIPDGQDVRIDRGQTHDPLAVQRQENVGVSVVDRILEAGAAALLTVAGSTHARRFE